MAKKILKWWTTSEWLNINQEEFCRLYATIPWYFGNWSESYIMAYWLDRSKKNTSSVARAGASNLLTKPNILQRINEQLEYIWFNDTTVDKELMFLISQHADFSSKVAAIKEYNKLKQRITDKIENIHTVVIDKDTPLEVLQQIIGNK